MGGGIEAARGDAQCRIQEGALPFPQGEMAEWLKAHAWKACVPQGTVGSNPTLSASYELRQLLVQSVSAMRQAQLHTLLLRSLHPKRPWSAGLRQARGVENPPA